MSYGEVLFIPICGLIHAQVVQATAFSARLMFFLRSYLLNFGNILKRKFRGWNENEKKVTSSLLDGAHFEPPVFVCEHCRVASEIIKYSL